MAVFKQSHDETEVASFLFFSLFDVYLSDVHYQKSMVVTSVVDWMETDVNASLQSCVSV